MKEIEIKLTFKERDLIINKTMADSALIKKLKIVDIKEKYIKVSFSLEEIDELAGFIAAEANHVKDKKLQNQLDKLYEKLAKIEEATIKNKIFK